MNGKIKLFILTFLLINTIYYLFSKLNNYLDANLGKWQRLFLKPRQ